MVAHKARLCGSYHGGYCVEGSLAQPFHAAEMAHQCLRRSRADALDIVELAADLALAAP